MKNDVTAEVCANCGHCLIKGVACDWEPNECPIAQEKMKERHAKKHAFHGEFIAAKDETSFILSAN